MTGTLTATPQKTGAIIATPQKTGSLIATPQLTGELYRLLLKVRGYTGESLEIENTIDYFICGIINGKSTQAGTPTPSAPIPVLSAGGNLISHNADNSLSSNIVMPAMRSLPNGTKDTLEYLGSGTWRHTQRTGHKVFDGTEAWALANANNFYLVVSDLVPTLSDNIISNSMCSYFKPATPSQVYNGGVGNAHAVWHSTAKWLRFFSSAHTTSADFKAWIAAQNTAGTPVTVDYELATPIVTDLSLGELKTYTGETVLTQDGTTKAMLNVKARVTERG